MLFRSIRVDKNSIIGICDNIAIFIQKRGIKLAIGIRPSPGLAQFLKAQVFSGVVIRGITFRIRGSQSKIRTKGRDGDPFPFVYKFSNGLEKSGFFSI